MSEIIKKGAFVVLSDFGKVSLQYDRSKNFLAIVKSFSRDGKCASIRKINNKDNQSYSLDFLSEYRIKGVNR